MLGVMLRGGLYSVLLALFLSLLSYWYYTPQELPESFEGCAHNLTIDEMAEDLDVLADLFNRLHPVPVPDFSLTDPIPLLKELKSELTSPMSCQDFYLTLAPVISAVGDEHTAIEMPLDTLRSYREEGGGLFPVQVHAIDGRLYLAADIESQPDSRGREILDINGIDAGQIVMRLRELFSGGSDYQRDYFLARSFADALYLRYGFGEHIVLKTRDPRTGEELVIEAKGVPGKSSIDADGMALNSSPYLYREPSNSRVLDSGDVVFEFRSFDQEEGNLNEVIETVFSELFQRPDARLIIDMRENDGGDTRIANQLIARLHDQPFHTLVSADLHVSPEFKSHWLSFIPPALRWIQLQYLHPWSRPLFLGEDGEEVTILFEEVEPAPASERFAGDVVVLMGSANFSAAASFLDTVKHYGVATLVGTPSGGSPLHYGNVMKHRLPNSHLQVLIPVSTNYGHTRRPVEPDVSIPLSPVDLREGRDAQMQQVLGGW